MKISSGALRGTRCPVTTRKRGAGLFLFLGPRTEHEGHEEGTKNTKGKRREKQDGDFEMRVRLGGMSGDGEVPDRRLQSLLLPGVRESAQVDD
jgi:hypothetical protein